MKQQYQNQVSKQRKQQILTKPQNTENRWKTQNTRKIFGLAETSEETVRQNENSEEVKGQNEASVQIIRQNEDSQGIVRSNEIPKEVAGQNETSEEILRQNENSVQVLSQNVNQEQSSKLVTFVKPVQVANCWKSQNSLEVLFKHENKIERTSTATSSLNENSATLEEEKNISANNVQEMGKSQILFKTVQVMNQQISENQMISIFPSHYSKIFLLAKGKYTFDVSAEGAAQFWGEHSETKENSIVAELRFSYGFKNQNKQRYYKNNLSNSFSLEGVYYNSRSRKHLQLKPLALKDDTKISIEVIMDKEGIKIIKQSKLYIQIDRSPRFSDILCIEGQNIKSSITYFAQGSYLEGEVLKIDKDVVCAICFDEVNDWVSTQCGHQYHVQCLEQWKTAKAEAACPLCRRLCI